MRFLCLHGRGTCSKIFEMQTARIREELDGHEFVFINGMVSTEPIAGATALAEECYGYLPSRVDPSQCYDMVAGLVQYVQSQGPFDGVMGFSEGGIVAAMLLVEDARYPFAGFKCGIFFSAALPLDPDVVRTGIVRCIDPVADGVLLHIPTTVVIEENLVRLRDRSPLAPLWLQEDAQEALIQICDEASREVVRHNLGHHVPGSKSVEKLAETLRAIERTIERAGDISS